MSKRMKEIEGQAAALAEAFVTPEGISNPQAQAALAASIVSGVLCDLARIAELVGDDLPLQPQHRHRRQTETVLDLTDLRQQRRRRVLLLSDAWHGAMLADHSSVAAQPCYNSREREI